MHEYRWFEVSGEITADERLQREEKCSEESKNNRVQAPHID